MEDASTRDIIRYTGRFNLMKFSEWIKQSEIAQGREWLEKIDCKGPEETVWSNVTVLNYYTPIMLLHSYQHLSKLSKLCRKIVDFILCKSIQTFNKNDLKIKRAEEDC